MTKSVGWSIRVGDIVRAKVGLGYRNAEVLELRGRLGSDDQIVRIRFAGDEDPPIDSDVPASTLELSPIRTNMARRSKRLSSA